MSVLDLEDATTDDGELCPGVKTHLKITGQQDDIELQATLEAAEKHVAERVGPLAPTTVTQRVRATDAGLYLSVTPVLELTSVTRVGGLATDVATLFVDGGSVTMLDGRSAVPSGTYDIVYEAGFPAGDLPDDLQLAIKELVRHLWRSQRGAGRTRPSPPPDVQTVGYLVPNMVAALIEPYTLPALG